MQATLILCSIVKARLIQERESIMLDSAALNTLFCDARSHNGWLDKPVSEEQLHQIYDLMKWGPTAANGSPARIVFVRSAEARKKLVACVSAGNTEKVGTAPVTAIIGMDMAFYEKLPQLFPHVDARPWFAGQPKVIEETAFRSRMAQGSTLLPREP